MNGSENRNTTVVAILSRGAISAEEVRKLRFSVFWKGVVTAEDAELVFTLNDRLGTVADPSLVDASWPPFFVEALTDYLVMQAEPQGYVSDDNAAWLIDRIARSGQVETETELELLVKVLERARMSPARLIAFALEQVKLGVIAGQGVVGRHHRLKPGVIGEAEVELIRRMLFAFGGDGNMSVTRAEAAVLFDINDATVEAENNPAWSDLFVKAIANFLMAASGYRVPSRQDALRREAWLDAPTAGVAGFMSQMLAGSLDALFDAYDNRSLDGEPAEAEPRSGLFIGDKPAISATDAGWAAERIRRDRRLHANEIALVNFLKTRQAHLHPELTRVLDSAA